MIRISDPFSQTCLPRACRLKPQASITSVVMPATAGDVRRIPVEGNDAAALRSARGGAAGRLRVWSLPADLHLRR